MARFPHVIPQDNTFLPGMKTMLADASDSNNIRYVPDVEYVKRGDLSMKLQLLLPADCVAFGDKLPNVKRPLLVYVQGAAWFEQDCYASLPKLVEVAKAGFVVASVKHRASFVAPFPAFLQDVKSAIRFLKKNAEKYGIDPDRVAIWGDSSGGHTSLMTGFTADMAEFKTEDNADISDAVNVVVDFYGPTDLSRINDGPRNPIFTADKDHIPEDILFGGCVLEHPEIAEVGNPIHYVTPEKAVPPVLIVHGNWDSMVPFNQSVLMYEHLVKCNKTVEFIKVIGAEHGVSLWTTEVVDYAIKFLKAYL